MYVRRVGGGEQAFPALREDPSTDLPVSSQPEESLQENCQEKPGKKKIHRAGEKIVGPA